jgi:hypothetical protein
MTDILLRKAQAGRAGAQGDDDYDVIDAGGLVIGRIFKATTSPAGTPWMWAIAYGNHEANHEDRKPTHGYEATRQAAMRHSARVGTEFSERRLARARRQTLRIRALSRMSTDRLVDSTASLARSIHPVSVQLCITERPWVSLVNAIGEACLTRCRVEATLGSSSQATS